MNKSTIFFIGLLSTWADAATTIIASHYPDLKESNPLANPFLETLTVLGGQALILKIGEKTKVNPKIRDGAALTVSIVPFLAAANNIAHITVIEARTYPWKQCPLLYGK